MFAICVEASHAKGLGHLFRAIHLSAALERSGHRTTVLLNDDPRSGEVLKAAGVPYQTVDLFNAAADWEAEIIARCGITLWINDRLDTSCEHATRVTRRSVPVVTFDDCGPGARLAELNIVALPIESGRSLLGKRIIRGLEYLVLDPAIKHYRRLRRDGARLVVSLGGTDTYGVTVKVAAQLRAMNRAATIIIGPGFRHEEALARVVGPSQTVRRNVPSLAAEFSLHDVAITSGGITAFEGNAAGLPCVIVANEDFEIARAMALANLGASVFAGHHTSMDLSVLEAGLPVEAMSRAGLSNLPLDGADRAAAEIVSLV